jgi:hypothetical protein
MSENEPVVAVDELPGVLWIRDGRKVYERQPGAEKFYLMEAFKTINAAKRFTKDKPLGQVARKETIVDTKGVKLYRSLIE